MLQANAGDIAASIPFLTGLQSATIGAGGAFVDTQGYTITFAQPLLHDATLDGSPDGGLTKVGSGLLLLAGASSYTGPTMIAEGTLQVAAGNNRLPVTTALTIDSGAALDLAGNNQTIGSLSGPAGAVVTDSATYGYTVVLTASPASGSTTFAGNIAESALAGHDSIALAVAGGGQLVLSGTNVYTGGTTVSSGTLSVAAASALPSAGVLVVGRSGRVVLGNNPTFGAAALLIASAPEVTDSGVALMGVAAPATLGEFQNPSGNAATVGDARSPQQGIAGIAVGGPAATVPEPGTIALLVAGVLMLAVARWRRRG